MGEVGVEHEAGGGGVVLTKLYCISPTSFVKNTITKKENMHFLIWKKHQHSKMCRFANCKFKETIKRHQNLTHHFINWDLFVVYIAIFYFTRLHTHTHTQVYKHTNTVLMQCQLLTYTSALSIKTVVNAPVNCCFVDGFKSKDENRVAIPA